LLVCHNQDTATSPLGPEAKDSTSFHKPFFTGKTEPKLISNSAEGRQQRNNFNWAGGKKRAEVCSQMQELTASLTLVPHHSATVLTA